MQTITVEGYLAADPVILTAQGSGRKRASFRLLETARFRRADGQQGERTTGFNCLCFKEATADNYLAPSGRKGSRVVVQGHVENDTCTGKDGKEHYDLRLIVDEIRIKNRRDRPETENGGDVESSGREIQRPASGYDSNDDIPF